MERPDSPLGSEPGPSANLCRCAAALSEERLFKKVPDSARRINLRPVLPPERARSAAPETVAYRLKPTDAIAFAPVAWPIGACPEN